MRMWMVPPALLCQQHLLGEHVETHMFLGAVRKGKNLGGYMRRNQFFPEELKPRHDALAAEMLRRGLKHNSPLMTQAGDVEQLLPYTYDPENPGQPDTAHVDEALRDLRTRCLKCAARQQGVKA